jgi:hypothetical protein
MAMTAFLKRMFTYPRWFIAYRRTKPFTTPFDTGGFKIIEPPSGSYYADPFVIKAGGRNYLFFEEYSFIKSKGFISFVEIDAAGNHTAPAKVLERDYHLSYPCVFKVDGQFFMLPETGENGTIELYAAKKFPGEWTLAQVLMKDISACDTTVWFADDKVWLFTNILAAGGRPYTDLHLFYADSLFGQWRAHPLNPVISDISMARPAGRLFWHNGDIIRPGQNSLLGYGHALVFNKVTHLTENDYRETVLEQIDPAWHPGGQSCHTYNASEDWEVIDCEIVTRDLLKPCRKAAAYLYRLSRE